MRKSLRRTGSEEIALRACPLFSSEPIGRERLSARRFRSRSDFRKLTSRFSHFIIQSTMNNARRPWMSRQIYRRCPSENRINGTTNCKGCGREFRAQVSLSGSENITRKRGELAYFVHCVEECEQYKALGLLSVCELHKLTFLTPQGLKRHQLCHGSSHLGQSGSEQAGGQNKSDIDAVPRELGPYALRKLDGHDYRQDSSSTESGDEGNVLPPPPPLIRMLPLPSNASSESLSRDRENEMSDEVEESAASRVEEERNEPSTEILYNNLNLAHRSLSLVALCYDSDFSDDEAEEGVAMPIDLSVHKELNPVSDVLVDPLIEDDENQIALDSPLDLTMDRNSPNLVVSHPNDQMAVDDDISIVYEDIWNPLQVANAIELE